MHVAASHAGEPDHAVAGKVREIDGVFTSGAVLTRVQRARDARVAVFASKFRWAALALIVSAVPELGASRAVDTLVNRAGIDWLVAENARGLVDFPRPLAGYGGRVKMEVWSTGGILGAHAMVPGGLAESGWIRGGAVVTGGETARVDHAARVPAAAVVVTALVGGGRRGH